MKNKLNYTSNNIILADGHKQPLVSVVIPVYNTEKYIDQAITSVLDQTYNPIEIICVNNGSGDNSISILKSFGDKIKIINQEKNTGISDARNSGVEITNGEYLAFLDADDFWEKDKIEIQMKKLLENPEIDICFSNMKCFISPELSDEIKKIRYCPPDPNPGFIAGTSIMKIDFFRKVGNFDPKWRVGEFIDWLSRAQSMGAICEMMPNIFLHRRIHNTNTGVTDRSSRVDYLKIVRESLNRKRSE